MGVRKRPRQVQYWQVVENACLFILTQTNNFVWFWVHAFPFFEHSRSKLFEGQTFGHFNPYPQKLFFFQNRIGESEGSESLPVRVNFIACSTCINRHFFSRAAFTSLERYYGISTGELSRFLTGKLLQCLSDNLDFYNIGHIEKAWMEYRSSCQFCHRLLLILCHRGIFQG